MLTVRSATPDDAEVLRNIYAYYVEETAISFEFEVPSAEEFRRRIENTLAGYPYLVAEHDGRPIGYAYAGNFRPRPAYDHCCELTVYLDKNERKGGAGGLLYRTIESELARRGFEICYACIAVPCGEDEYVDTNSRDFHAHMGYETVGVFRRSGKKFGHYYDMVYMEKQL